MLLITVQLITEIYDEVIPEQQKCDQILLIKIKKTPYEYEQSFKC